MKCINCFREIDDNLKFCKYCGTKQPADRAAYEREHPELAEAISEEELLEHARQQQIEEGQLRQAAEHKAQEGAERNAGASEQTVPIPGFHDESLEHRSSSPTRVAQGGTSSYEPQPQPQQEPGYRPITYSNLIPCPECGNLVSPRAYSCPKCGYPINDNPNTRPQQSNATKMGDRQPRKSDNGNVVWFLLAFIGILAVLIALFSSKNCSGRRATGYDTSADSVYVVDTAYVEAAETSASAASAAAYDETQEEEYVDASRYRSSDFICHSEDVSSNDLGGDAGSNLGDKSVWIDNAWLEHDVNSGLRIHVDMTATNLRDCTLDVVCFFWFADGRPIEDADGNYARHGQICTSTRVSPSHDSSNWSDLRLWIPYTQIKGQRDRKHLKGRVEVYYNGHCLATSNYLHFDCWVE